MKFLNNKYFIDLIDLYATPFPCLRVQNNPTAEGKYRMNELSDVAY